MQKEIHLRLLPSEAASQSLLPALIARELHRDVGDVTGYYIIKRSIDARGKNVWINLSLLVFINEPFHERPLMPFHFKEVHHARKKVIIIGGGPAGMFAALQLIENGIQPIILERGKDVRSRRRDIAALNKEGTVNPESNYCFGEGGAGTYSDGKLYTRSSKRGDISRILNLFVHFGADENILYTAHPHIGTNKLPAIITAMRKQITDCGGLFCFNKKVTDIVSENDMVRAVRTADGDTFAADAYILATGHSARDIFEMLQRRGFLLEAKGFALGVRVEHPQEIINSLQYACDASEAAFLPPAAYSLVQQVDGRGVFSFCMCPGGIIAPAATTQEELVVNGWSPSKRNNPYANSGMVVQVETADVQAYMNASQTDLPAHHMHSPLLMMEFQKMVEQNAYMAGGGRQVAPAQRMVDFTKGQLSGSLPQCSYLPGITSVPLKEVLPPFISERLSAALRLFGRRFSGGKKYAGYFTNEAVLVATESRTSSPVRIPRTEALSHPQLKNLFPAGEGAGYAGGIVSAAMDGERVARAISGF